VAAGAGVMLSKDRLSPPRRASMIATVCRAVEAKTGGRLPADAAKSCCGNGYASSPAKVRRIYLEASPSVSMAEKASGGTSPSHGSVEGVRKSSA
jgi:hypothetical protein